MGGAGCNASNATSIYGPASCWGAGLRPFARSGANEETWGSASQLPRSGGGKGWECFGLLPCGVPSSKPGLMAHAACAHCPLPLSPWRRRIHAFVLQPIRVSWEAWRWFTGPRWARGLLVLTHVWCGSQCGGVGSGGTSRRLSTQPRCSCRAKRLGVGHAASTQPARICTWHPPSGGAAATPLPFTTTGTTDR